MFRRWVRLYTVSRAVNPHAAHAIVSLAKEIRSQITSLVDVGAMSVFIPVFPTAGFFELPSSNRSLAKFWLAFVEAVMNEDLTASHSHCLVFIGSHNEIEISDEWGGGWFFILRHPGSSGESDRSRSNTPVRRRSPAAMTMDTAYLLDSPR